MAGVLVIRVDDVSDERTIDLLRLHAEGMEAASPPGTCHYFDADELRRPEVTLWTGWVGDDVAVCGALLELDTTHGEIKSMRTAPAHLGTGAGRAMLDHIIGAARERGYRRLSLETGRSPEFEAAVGLYERSGFVPCGPFGGYAESEFSQYFTLQL